MKLRVLGIDYGSRRVGLAYGDELGVATPLAAAVEATEPERVERIAAVVAERGITEIVLGYPYNMDGSAGFKAKEVEAFAEVLKARIHLPIHYIDERLTSQAVERDFGWSARRERSMRKTGVVDSAAARLILQDWLDQRIAPPELEDCEGEWERDQ